MRGKSSSSKTKACGLENDSLDKIKEPHLSGAYIRSLVKQLTSSRTKDVENLEAPEGSKDGSFSDRKTEKSSNEPPPQQHKKQVRRRLHTSRPYQERLLNMAEARREIVTALKFHRASMKQATEKQQQLEEPSSNQASLEQEAKSKSRRNPRVYASNSSTTCNNNNNFPPNYMENFSYSPGFCSPYPWHVSPIPPPTPPPLFHENNLNFTLPSQTLGLNLNLQDFNYFETTPFNNNPSSIYSSSSPSTSSSPLSATTGEEIPPPPQVAEFEDSGLHYAMDDKEMAEIRSIGEQYQMEWNDTLNLVNSAWWFKFLKSMEMENNGNKGEAFVNSPFDEDVEFPSWLNANEQISSHDYFQDPDLPCMDIEEIEGMDGDWLA